MGKYFELKQELIGPPDIYLGGRVSKVTLENVVEAWSFSSTQHVKYAVENIYRYIKEHEK